MKRFLLSMAAVFAAGSLMAQKDSTGNTVDTIKVGNYIIIKKNKPLADKSPEAQSEKKKNRTIDISFGKNDKKRKNSNISTNWWIVDLGFANYRDETNYTNAQAGSYFKILRTADGPVTAQSNALNISKSSNVNIWAFMQKVNISKHVLNLKYGLGYEMYNYRFERSLSYRNNPSNFVFNDSINFSKNKLFVGYLTVPFMINIQPTPQNKRSFSLSAGVSAGYLLGARNKQISSQRGKEKINSSFDLEPFKLAAIGEVGLGPVRLYGSYSFNALHKSSTRLEQYPYAIGVRFSNW